MKNDMWRLAFARSGLGCVVLGLLLLSSCGASQISGPAITHGLAHIEGVEVFMLESFPVQVHVYIAGLLQDSCTTLDAVTQERSGNIFWIRVTTVRPTDALCADKVTPFEERVALDVYGLPAGTYRVDVHGVEETFTFTVDNVLP